MVMTGRKLKKSGSDSSTSKMPRSTAEPLLESASNHSILIDSYIANRKPHQLQKSAKDPRLPLEIREKAGAFAARFIAEDCYIYPHNSRLLKMCDDVCYPESVRSVALEQLVGVCGAWRTFPKKLLTLKVQDCELPYALRLKVGKCLIDFYAEDEPYGLKTSCLPYIDATIHLSKNSRVPEEIRGYAKNSLLDQIEGYLREYPLNLMEMFQRLDGFDFENEQSFMDLMVEAAENYLSASDQQKSKPAKLLLLAQCTTLPLFVREKFGLDALDIFKAYATIRSRVQNTVKIVNGTEYPKKVREEANLYLEHLRQEGHASVVTWALFYGELRAERMLHQLELDGNYEELQIISNNPNLYGSFPLDNLIKNGAKKRAKAILRNLVASDSVRFLLKSSGRVDIPRKTALECGVKAVTLLAQKANYRRIESIVADKAVMEEVRVAASEALEDAYKAAILILVQKIRQNRKKNKI